jgi:hypothetical protein
VITGRHVPFRGFDPHGELAIDRRRLPHWRQIGVAYFITFRLADSVPQTLLRQWRDERITLRDGGKFALGTDDPHGLTAGIRDAIRG